MCEQTLTCVHTYDQHTKFLNNNTGLDIQVCFADKDLDWCVVAGGMFPFRQNTEINQLAGQMAGPPPPARLLFILNYSAGKFIGYN